MCWWGNHLFVIFAVLDVSLAVNLCINCSFLHLLIYKRILYLKPEYLPRAAGSECSNRINNANFLVVFHGSILLSFWQWCSSWPQGTSRQNCLALGPWPSPQRSKPWPWHLHRHFLASPSTSRLDNYYNDNRLWCGGIGIFFLGVDIFTFSQFFIWMADCMQFLSENCLNGCWPLTFIIIIIIIKVKLKVIVHKIILCTIAVIFKHI